MKPTPGLSGHFAASMLACMVRLARPSSTWFRLSLAFAWLAWTALAFGAPPVTAANPAHAPQSQAQPANGVAHCQGAMIASAGSHVLPAPMASTGHGDCCQTTCRCLAPSPAAMTVPWIFVAFIPPGGDWPAGCNTPVSPLPAAQPLRPPIG